MNPEVIQTSRAYLNYVSPKPAGTCLWNRGNRSELYDLSIIIPCYNAENYIRKCLDSILEQEIQDRMEILVVDDGSTDETNSILNQYGSKGLIQVIRQENAGPSAARNHALQNAKGRNVTFVDADDVLFPDSLAPLLDEAMKQNLDVIQGGMIRFRDGEKPIWNDADEHSARWNGYVCGKIIRNSLFDEMCYPQGYWFEDMIAPMLILPRCQKKRISHNAFYAYRVQNKSITSAQNGINVKTIDAFWALDLNCDAQVALSIPMTQELYEQFLHDVALTYASTVSLDNNTKTAVFYLNCQLWEDHHQHFTTTDRFQHVLEEGLAKQDYQTYCDGAALYWNHMLPLLL